MIIIVILLIGISIGYTHMPEIQNNKVILPYGNTLKDEQIKLKNAILNDNCIIDQESYDKNKIGTQYAEAIVTNFLGRKEIRKVKVTVVDKYRPVFTIKNGNNHNNIVYINVNSNPDISNYISVRDDIDGKLNFATDKKLKTNKIGTQKIKLTAEDSSGNVSMKTYYFHIMDYKPPTIKIKKNSVINYGNKVKLSDYYEVKDNYDKHVKVINPWRKPIGLSMG